MNLPSPLRHARRAGNSLIVTLVLTAVATIVLTATLKRQMTTAKLNDRTDQYMVAMNAAEAATEKVMARMAVDFNSGGEVTLSNNNSYYRSSLLPTTNENPFWNNFQFSDGQGNANQTYVARLDTNPNPQYVILLQQYPGLSAFASTYRVLSNVKYTNSNYGFVAAVAQDLQMAEVPVFQFAIFYNTLLEFSDCAPLTINGRVHCNTNIYVGTISSSSLTFNYMVTASGTITNPAWFGYAQSSWQGPITYNGTPSPGYGTGAPNLTLPVGTNNTPAAVREIINVPPAGESTTNPVSSQRYFNKADMIITVKDASLGLGTNMTSNNFSVSIAFKNSMYDGSPLYLYLGATNYATNVSVATNVNWANTGVSNWLTTNVTFYDQREGMMTRTTQIDIAQLGKWMGTNTAYCSNKWSAGNPFDGVIYVQDLRTSANLECVRLVNGSAITNGSAASNTPFGIWQSGLTVATPNPLYVWGNYNCPKSAYLQTTNTTLSRPCSFICDALTILSPAWDDAKAINSSSTLGSRNSATDTTVNAALIAGNVLSTDATDTGFSGGVHNLPRLLEDWGGNNLWLNTSMICLYNSVQATHQFQKPGIYYNAPSRHFMFDLNFTTSTGLPPGTPLVNLMNRASWCNPQPGNVTFVNPPQLFVPH